MRDIGMEGGASTENLKMRAVSRAREQNIISDQLASFCEANFSPNENSRTDSFSLNG